RLERAVALPHREPVRRRLELPVLHGGGNGHRRPFGSAAARGGEKAQRERCCNAGNHVIHQVRRTPSSSSSRRKRPSPARSQRPSQSARSWYASLSAKPRPASAIT